MYEYYREKLQVNHFWELKGFTPRSDQQGLPPCIIHTFTQRGNE